MVRIRPLQYGDIAWLRRLAAGTMPNMEQFVAWLDTLVIGGVSHIPLSDPGVFTAVAGEAIRLVAEQLEVLYPKDTEPMDAYIEQLLRDALDDEVN